MINKTRIVGNNVGEETFKIQNKWRKYKTTQSEDFVKEILCFPLFGSLIRENRAPPCGSVQEIFTAQTGNSWSRW